MVQYLSIIRKSDFIDLFKYGHSHVHYALSFNGELSEHDEDRRLFELLTAKMNPFEYSFEYLLIYFQKDKYNGSSLEIQMKDILGIYAFNAEAKKEMSISFDPRIQIHVSSWAKWFDELQKEQFIKQSLHGIDNLWKIFGLDEEDKVKSQRIIEGDVIAEVFRELYAYERPSGEQSLWTYLLRYERHSLYPRDMVGFFCDFIHVVCNWMKKTELSEDVAESTVVYHELKGSQFRELANVVLASRLSGMTENATGCRFCVVAPLFLFLKSLFSSGVDMRQTYNGTPVVNIIEYSKKTYCFEFALAAYLLGVTLGFDKSYDAYYEAIELPVFKKKTAFVVMESKMNSNPSNADPEIDEFLEEYQKVEDCKIKEAALEEPKQEDNHLDDSKSQIQASLFPKEDTTNEDHPIAYFYLKSDKKNLIPVYTKEEADKFKKNKDYSKKRMK